MKAVSYLLFSLFLLSACSAPSGPVGVVDESAQTVEQKKFDYVNDNYGFAINFPKDYKVRYLENGVLFRKDVPADPEYDSLEPLGALASYTVEIAFLPFENVTEYKNLNDYISFKYSGYSIEGATFDNVSGYFVDEGIGENAVRHFFTVKEGSDVIYEAYLKLPSFQYAKHVGGFEELIKGMDIF